jgi:hypothetical protein
MEQSFSVQLQSWGSFSYAFGPVFALGGLALVIVLLRRSFRRPGPTIDDDEVLAPLLGPRTWTEVTQVARLLTEAGIRHRVMYLPTSYQLQVPADDLSAARAVLRGAPAGPLT